jgi:hypothetical protein
MTKGYPTHDLIQLALDSPLYDYQGPRKIVRNLLWTPERLPDPPDLETLGYQPKTKMRNLIRTYFNEEEVAKVRAHLESRDHQQFTTLSCSMRGATKKKESMGWCMEACTIRTMRSRRKLSVTMMYRSTEIIQKFTADLAFLPYLFERLGIQPEEVHFFFSSAYLSMVFLPSLFCYVEPVPFLKRLKKRDPQLFRIAVRYLSRSFRDVSVKMPYSPEHRQHVLAFKRYPEKIPQIMEYLLTQREDGRYA